MKKRKFITLMALAGVAVPSLARAADSVNVYQIAVTGMSVPGTGGTYTSFSAPTTNRDVDHGLSYNPFFFIATSSNGNSGVYTYDTVSGIYSDLADTTMAAGTGGTFASFSDLSSGEGALGFIATDSNGNQGVYEGGYNALALIATPNTSPTAGVTLGNIYNISITGDPYGTPAGLIESATGVYDFIAGSSPPHSINYGSLTSFGPVSYKGSIGNSNLPGIYLEAGAFTAMANGVSGVYYSGSGSDTSFTALASIGGSTPNVAGTFTSFGNPYVTANEVTFTAHYHTPSGDQQGIFVYGPYEAIGNIAHLRQIVATGQVAPNSGGATFTGFSDISDTSFDETFIASLSNGGEGLYIEFNEGISYSPGPQLLKVVETGDTINGQTVASIELAPDASNYYTWSINSPYTPNTGIGFEVNFTDGTEGLYYFDVNLPEPASICLIGLPLLLTRRPRSR
jgi:hypothetical protein